MKAVFLFLIAFCFVLPAAMAQTTVFEETFPNSAIDWHVKPTFGVNTWHPESIGEAGAPLALGSTHDDDSSSYAYAKNSFSLVSNRTYRVSVKCSLAANPGTKEVVLGIGPNAQNARRSVAQVVLQTGALSTSGWSTFTATFNTTGDLSSWTNAVVVLWANVLSTPRYAMVYADDIKFELLSNQAPSSVSITSPTGWEVVNSPATIAVTAADPDNNIDRVKFYSGTTYLGEDLTSPYSLSANLSPGTRSVKAVAIDQYGLSLESASRTFVINTPPAVTSTAPADGAQYTNSGSVSLSATASDEDFNLTKVEFYVNGQKVGEDNTAPYAYSYSNSSGGQFTWHARAVDDMSLWGLSEDRSFNIDAPPTTSIISPQSHGTVGSCNVYIQAETNLGPGGILAMNFFRNDTLIGTDSISPYEYKGSGWAAGEYSIEARGVDMTGMDIIGATVSFSVEAAEVVLNLTESNQSCKYIISGVLAPNQSLTLSALSNATDADNYPYQGMELVTGKEEKEWSQLLNFTDYSPVGLGYTLTNAYGCEATGTFTLHPESKYAPNIETEPVLVSGLKLDPNSGQYYYCEPDAANLVIQPIVTNTTGTVWYQALNPADQSQVYQTFTNTNGTVQITSPMLEEQQLVLNAITPLGCTGGHPLTINFSGRQAPTGYVFDAIQIPIYGSFADQPDVLKVNYENQESLTFCGNSRPTFIGNTLPFSATSSSGTFDAVFQENSYVLELPPVRNQVSYSIVQVAQNGCSSEPKNIILNSGPIPSSPLLAHAMPGDILNNGKQIVTHNLSNLELSYSLAPMATLAYKNIGSNAYDLLAGTTSNTGENPPIVSTPVISVRQLLGYCPSPEKQINLVLTNTSLTPTIVNGYPLNDSMLVVKADSIQFQMNGFGKTRVRERGQAQWIEVLPEKSFALSADSVWLEYKGVVGSEEGPIKTSLVYRLIIGTITTASAEPAEGNVNLSYEASNAHGVLVAARQGGAIGKPVDGVTYVANSNYGQGDHIEQNGYCLINSSTILGTFGAQGFNIFFAYQLSYTPYKVVKGIPFYGNSIERWVSFSAANQLHFDCRSSVHNLETAGRYPGDEQCDFLPNFASTEFSKKQKKIVNVAIHVMGPPHQDGDPEVQFRNISEHLYLLRSQFKTPPVSDPHHLGTLFTWPQNCDPSTAGCVSYPSVNYELSHLHHPTAIPLQSNNLYNWQHLSLLPDNDDKFRDNANIEFRLARIYFHEVTANDIQEGEWWVANGHVVNMDYVPLYNKYVLNGESQTSCNEPAIGSDIGGGSTNSMTHESKSFAHLFMVEANGGTLTRVVNGISLSVASSGGELKQYATRNDNNTPSNTDDDYDIGPIAFIHGQFNAMYYHPWEGILAVPCSTITAQSCSLYVENRLTPPVPSKPRCYCLQPEIQRCNCETNGLRKRINMSALIIHEFGHAFGLQHNVYDLEPYNSTYNDPSYLLNPSAANLMYQPLDPDHPGNDPLGDPVFLSASQVGLMLKNIEQDQYSGYLVNNFCEVQEQDRADNVIPGNKSIVWAGKRNLGGNITVSNTAQLDIHCEIGIPQSVAGLKAKVLVGMSVEQNVRGDLQIKNTTFGQARTKSMTCPGAAELEFGDGSAQGLVTLSGIIEVQEGVSLSFKAGSNTIIGPFTKIKGKGKMIFEAGSFVCVDPTAMIDVSEQLVFNIEDANLTINPSTPNQPVLPNSCASGCETASLTTTTGITTFCSPATTSNPITLFASTLFGGKYRFLDANGIEIQALANDNTLDVTVAAGESKIFTVEVHPDNCVGVLFRTCTLFVEAPIDPIVATVQLGNSCTEKKVTITSASSSIFSQIAWRKEGTSCNSLSLPFNVLLLKTLDVAPSCGFGSATQFRFKVSSLNQGLINYLKDLQNHSQKVTLRSTNDLATGISYGEFDICHIFSGGDDWFYLRPDLLNSVFVPSGGLNVYVFPSSFLYGDFQPELTFTESGNYSASIITTNGCLHSTSFCVDIKPSQSNLSVIPDCDEDGIFYVKGVEPPNSPVGGSFALKQKVGTQTTQIATNSNGYFQLYEPSGDIIGYDGEGFKILYQNSNACYESQPFQILGSESSYHGKLIPGNAFVHSNLVLTGHTIIGPGAKVYNRGQASITGSGNEEAPLVEAIKWTVGGKEGKLTIGDNALITAACDRMWYGIECTEAFEVAPPYLQVTLGANAEISHAYKAINFTLQDGNAKLTATGSIFLNNYIGFESNQLNLGGSTISGCTLLVEDAQLKYPFRNNPFTGHYRTGRAAVNLTKGIGTVSGAPLLISDQSIIRNYFIGINSYGIPFNLDHSRIERIRFKGVNIELTEAGIADNYFTFERNYPPIYNWMRYAPQPGCCGLGNKWPGLVSNSLPEYDATNPTIPLGAYGICSRYSGSTISGNTFESDVAAYESGTGCQVGILTNKATLTDNVFTNVDRGVVIVKEPGTTTAMPQQIKGNTFTNNLTGVYLDNGFQNLDLKCNVFAAETLGFSLDRKGLVIGADAELVGNRIGGLLSTTPTGSPNSNYFPRIINATNGAIEPFENYFSVWNESVNQISYYNFANEDLGNIYPQQSSGLSNYVDPEQVSDISITRQNLENWCLEIPSTVTQPNWKSNGVVSFPFLVDCREMEETELVTLKTAQLIPNNWVLACDGGPLDNVPFPIPRHAPSSLVAEMVESLTKDKVYLGQSIPNPAQSLVTIPVLLTELKGSAVLEIFELATGKALDQKNISGLGQHNVYFDVHTWASGVYGYRIVLPDGKSPAPRKMVLVK